MKLDKFWVVTDPIRLSTLQDICFETTPNGYGRQFLGGLTEDERPAIFTEEEEARKEAKSRLAKVKS